MWLIDNTGLANPPLCRKKPDYRAVFNDRSGVVDNDTGALYEGCVESDIKPCLTPLEAMDRITDAEQAAIHTAAKTDVVVAMFLYRFSIAASQGYSISLEDGGRFKAGMQYLEDNEILGAGRAAEITAHE